MTTQASMILTGFNDHFMEFVSAIISVFPNDTDILQAKNSFSLIRKANPKMIIKIWQKFVVEKYSDAIDNGDISFFISLVILHLNIDFIISSLFLLNKSQDLFSVET